MSLSHFSNIQLGKVIIKKNCCTNSKNVHFLIFFALWWRLYFVRFFRHYKSGLLCSYLNPACLAIRTKLVRSATPHVSRWHTEKFVRSFRFRSESVRFGVFRQSCLSFVDLDSVWDLRNFVVSGQSLWSVLQTNGRGGQVVDYVDVSNG